MIEIRVPARVHAGLIELSSTGYRTNGGVGWSMEAPELVVRAFPAECMSLDDQRARPLDASELAQVLCELERISSTEGLSAARISIDGDLLPHRGFGGGTALRLAAIECLMTLAGRASAPADLVGLAQRGGTSGVGIRTYFEGGLVFDLGHAGGGVARPSRDRTGCCEPLALLRLNMPEWSMGFLACDQLPAVTIEDERQLFAGTLPLNQVDVREALYHMTFGLIAAVAEGDPDTFAMAVDAVQLGGWKRAEWACHGHGLEEAADALRRAGARGVGLSSVGPALFFLADRLVVSDLPDNLAAALHITKPSNHGRILSVVRDG